MPENFTFTGRKFNCTGSITNGLTVLDKRDSETGTAVRVDSGTIEMIVSQIRSHG